MNGVTFTGKLGQRLYQAAQNLQEKTNDYQEAKKLDDKMDLGIIDAEDARLITKTKDILKDVSAKLNPGQPQEDTISFMDKDDGPFGRNYTPGTLYAVFSLNDALATY